MNILFAAEVVLFALLAQSSLANAVGPERVEEIVGGKCFICHGLEGESSSKQYPKLAGQHAEYIAKQLADFKSGRRKSDTMQAMSSDISAEEMLALGRYFETKTSPMVPRENAELAASGRMLYFSGNAASGVAACASCHGPRALGTAQLPRLAGQVRGYLQNQLQQFNTRERRNDNEVMHNVAARLSEQEVIAVSEFISSFE